jgi:hypothetical protein
MSAPRTSPVGAMGYVHRVAAKRRLPVLPSGGDADADPTRAPWQWVGFGSLAIFVVWVPLSAAAMTLAARIVPTGSSPTELAAPAIPIFLAIAASGLALAAAVGGFLVGRWGGAGVGMREASLAGLVAALVAVALSWARSGLAVGALLVVPFAVSFAALGGKLGRSARRQVR